ncbi:MAG: hypothetical protein Q9215_002054 [Flavoplaca cf. flavocitrina]
MLGPRVLNRAMYRRFHQDKYWPQKPRKPEILLNKQDDLQEIANSRGIEDETYKKALRYTRDECRRHGIDAALQFEGNDPGANEFDALILCDRKGAGQQLAAQAGMRIGMPFLCEHQNNKAVGYPIITIPIGINTAGFPVSLSFQHRAWQERRLVKWASAVEDLVHEIQGWRPTPEYRNFHAKNIPINSVP